MGRNDGPVAEIDLDLLACNRLRLIGVTFRTRTADEALQCSERCAADLAGAIDHGTLRPVLDRVFLLADLPAHHTYSVEQPDREDCAEHRGWGGIAAEPISGLRQR